LLGIPLKTGDRKVNDSSPSLDRKDPSRGYTPDNVWVISFRANTIKSNRTWEQLFEEFNAMFPAEMSATYACAI
jgi:hypothetical protein